MHNFRELKIWKDSLELSIEISQLCSGFPDYEKFGLANQLRRCAVSIPSNIAEGCSRNSPKEISRFLRIALGSSHELETQLIIANRLGYINEAQTYLEINNKIQRMIWNFINKINTN